MRIRDTFRTKIDRRIEEVINVGDTDDATVLAEIDEYVLTDRIEESLVKVLLAYQQTIPQVTPGEAARARRTIGPAAVWISGFFGSGKSSFAKILGHLFENRSIAAGETSQAVGRRFLPRCNDLQVQALLEGVWKNAPTISVFLELSSAQDVANETEGIVLPVYRALLRRLGYARNVKLAELEITLESLGQLPDFEEAFSLANGRPWSTSRDNALSVNMAAKALHHLDPSTYPSADSWAREEVLPALTAEWFAERACMLLQARGEGARRLVFVVDEVSQYIALSLDRIRAVQGFAEQVALTGGVLWFVATGQERLEEVVDSLENKATELARLKARFPITVDLLPSDIEEVVGRRVLDKSGPGGAEIAGLLATHRNKLAANLRLSSPTRGQGLTEADLLRLYPLAPYQVRLLIDAVDKRRSAVRGTAPMGGSNRTIIKHAQQLVTSRKAGLGDEEVGALVTMDRSYDLLEEVIPGTWRDEVVQVAAKYDKGASSSTEAQIMKAIALVHDVGALPLNAANLAVLLHPSITADGRRDEIVAALGRLVADDRLVEVDGSYQLQSVEQKSWEQERRALAMSIGDEARLRKKLLGEVLSRLTLSSPTVGKSFTVAVAIDGEPPAAGDLVLEVVATTASERQAKVDELRATTRDARLAHHLAWTFVQSDRARQALESAHKSRKMIDRHEARATSSEEKTLLTEEKARAERHEAEARALIEADMGAGVIVFRGVAEAAPAGAVRDAAVAALRERLPVVFGSLQHFGPDVDQRTVLAILTADLATLPAQLGDDGAGLFTVTADGGELSPEREPLTTFFTEVARLAELGTCSGKSLEQALAKPPYGAPVGMVQALVAAGVRLGRLEVHHGAQRLTSRTDRRFESVFATLPAFRRIEVKASADSGPSPQVRARLASKLQRRSGNKESANLEDLARRARQETEEGRLLLFTVLATLRGAGLGVPTPVRRALELCATLSSADDATAVGVAETCWDELTTGIDEADILNDFLQVHLADLQDAAAQARQAAEGLPAEAVVQHEALADLLKAGDIRDRIGEIRDLTGKVAAARSRAEAATAAALEALRAATRAQVHDTEEREEAGDDGDEAGGPPWVDVRLAALAVAPGGSTGTIEGSEQLQAFLVAVNSVLADHVTAGRRVRLR